MNYWMCDEYNYIFEADMPSNTCPGCHARCTFMNVSCYIPACGAPGHYDPKLVAQKCWGIKKVIKVIFNM